MIHATQREESRHTGKFSITDGASECGLCPVGKFLGTGGSNNNDACTDCPMGTYSDAEGVAECTVCDTGKYLASKATNKSADCDYCLVGKFLEYGSGGVACEGDLGTCNDNANDCKLCSEGTYSGNVAASSCTECETGTYSKATGASVSLFQKFTRLLFLLIWVPWWGAS